MLVKPISAVPATDSADPQWLRTLVTSVLSYSELASALAASDMPTKRVEMTTEQTVEYAVQGLARRGVDAVRQHAEDGHSVNLSMVDLVRRHSGRFPQESAMGRAIDAANRELWGSYRRKQRCHDAASRIHSERPDSPFNVARMRREIRARSHAA